MKKELRESWNDLPCGGQLELRGDEPVRLADSALYCADPGLGGHTCGPGCVLHADHAQVQREAEALLGGPLLVGAWERFEPGDPYSTALVAPCRRA
jgi:hypothetical protein